MKRFPFHSIRWRVQAWQALILLLAIGAFCFTAYRFSWNNHMRRIDNDLEQKLERHIMRSFFRSVQPPKNIREYDDRGREQTDFKAAQRARADDRERERTDFKTAQNVMAQRLRSGEITIPPELNAIFQNNDPGYVYFYVYDHAVDKVLIQSPNTPNNTPLPQQKHFSEDELSPPGILEMFRTVGSRRELVRYAPGGSFCTIVGRDITPELEAMTRYGWSLAGCGLAFWSLGLIGGWWLAGRAIKPIETISRTASRIADGNLSERINTKGTDNELDELGCVLNQTFDRLQAAFERQRQFTSDASHELRTPITILLSETQRILKRERSPDEYQDVIRTCHLTANRMRRLVEALLLLARQDNTINTVAKQTCNLAAILGESIHELSPLAKEKNVDIHADLQEAVCTGDAPSLSILVNNLISNAIQHHNPQGGNLYLSTKTLDGQACLIVRDDGPGIPLEDQPHIFERFYRADKARTGNTEHTGLGLAIVQTIANNHHATVTVKSESGKGTTFEVRF